MFVEIKKLNNLGIFHSLTTSARAPSFKKFNLIYGWNGSGKTTLSRLFYGLESGECVLFPEAEYKVTTDSQVVATNGQPLTSPKIMVFNQDYVAENAPSLDDPQAKSRHIYILGKKDKELAKKINEDKISLGKFKEEIDERKKNSLAHEKKQLENSRISKFKDAADTIAAIKGGTAIRTYNRRHAIEVYENLTEKQILSSAELEKTLKLVDQQTLDDLEYITVPKVDLMVKGKSQQFELFDFVDKLVSSMEDALEQTANQKLIERLVKNEDLAEWVAAGFELHSKHKSEKCEYCRQSLSADRLEELSGHFNEAFIQLNKQIDRIIKSLQLARRNIEKIQIVDKANFYSQFREDYETEKNNFDKEKNNILENMEQAIQLLQKKRNKTNQRLKLEPKLTTDTLKSSIESIDKIIKKHNDHTKSFKSTVEGARKKLEKHYVSKIYDFVKKIDKDTSSLSASIVQKEQKIKLLDESIAKDEATLSNSKEACDDINKCLIGILGRNEIEFEDQDEGYLIKRNGLIADNLSGGEKTAIAFAYFVIHLSSKDFDLSRGVVVIDDPISSLDIEGIFRVCTLMNTKLKKVNQLIILTHNFDFFNQIKKWFINDPEINNKDKQEDYQGQYMMIKNSYDKTSHKRIAFIDNLDPLLKDFESEYHYLFKKLLSFNKDIVPSTEGTIEAVYHYPNMARKVLECFLSFKVPSRGNLFTRMQKMKQFNKEITATDVQDVYDFINSNSHLNTKTGLIQFDPSLGANGEKYIKRTLKLIKDCDEKHYDAMVKLVEE